MGFIGAGDPFDEIAQMASRHHADLIVMGCHGRTGMMHPLVGRTAEKVVERAPCPVHVVRNDH